MNAHCIEVSATIAAMESPADRLKKAREDAGFAKAIDAANRFGWAPPTYYGHENGSRGLTAEAAQIYARAFRVPADWLLWGGNPKAPTIAVAGQVGAGASVELVDAYAKGGGIFHVEAPANIDPHGVVGVEVVGDSMVPIIQPGAVLLFTRHFEGVDPMDLGHVVICETDDGKVWVKQIRQGRDPGTYDLHSARDGLDPIYGQRVRWAARMRLLIPPEDVRRIEDLGAG